MMLIQEPIHVSTQDKRMTFGEGKSLPKFLLNNLQFKSEISLISHFDLCNELL